MTSMRRMELFSALWVGVSGLIFLYTVAELLPPIIPVARASLVAQASTPTPQAAPTRTPTPHWPTRTPRPSATPWPSATRTTSPTVPPTRRRPTRTPTPTATIAAPTATPVIASQVAPSPTPLPTALIDAPPCLDWNLPVSTENYVALKSCYKRLYGDQPPPTAPLFCPPDRFNAWYTQTSYFNYGACWSQLEGTPAALTQAAASPTPSPSNTPGGYP